MLGAGAVAAVGWSVAVALGAVLVSPVAHLLGYVYLLGAAGLTVAWWARPERMVEAGLWFWVLAPGVRRCVDLGGGFQQDSVVLLVAPLVSLAVGGAALLCPGRADHGAARTLALRLAVLIATAGGVAVVAGVAVPSVGIAGLQVLGPLGIGVGLLRLLSGQEREEVLGRFAVGVPIIVGGYGIVQYVVAPVWDRQWLVDVSDVALGFGRPEPFEIRVFSTVNDPGSLAAVLVLCVLLLVTRRSLGPLALLALSVGTVCLGLTLVRSSWIVLAVALAYLLVRGWVRFERVVVAAVIVSMVLVASGTALQPVIERFTSSTEAGAQDASFQERLAFQAENFVPALLDVVGSGLGSTGTAVRRDDVADQTFANADSGYLEFLRTFGGPLGTLLVASVVGVSLRTAWRRPHGLEGAAAGLAAVPVQLLFTNVLAGVTGVMFWVGLVLCHRAREA
jgi:hypothetical protein